MPQIFFDNFDNETIGQPPSNWEVSNPAKVKVIADPSPDYLNDLCMYMNASSGNETVTATRSFAPQTEVVELNFKFYVAQITQPQGSLYKFCEIATFNTQADRVLTLALTHRHGGTQQILLYTAPDKVIILGRWSWTTWHKIKLRFTYTGIFNWVEIFIDDQTVPYCFGQGYSSINQLKFAVKSQTIGGQTCSCTVLVDDVECSRQAYEISDEYFCPVDKFSMVFPIEPASTGATFYDGGLPLISYNWQTGFEPTNVNHPHLGKEWRSMLVNPRKTSGSTIAEHLLSFDLGSAQTVEAVGILNHNLADELISSDSPPRDFFLVATDDINKPINEWDYHFNLNIVAMIGWYIRMAFGESNTPLGLTNILVFPNKTYRYWGIFIRQYAPMDNEGKLQTSSLEYFKIGRVVLGTLGEAIYNFSDDWQIEVVDPSRIADNAANARWARAINPYRVIRTSFELNDVDGEQIASIFGLLRKEPFIYIVIPERVNIEPTKTSWVYARISKDSLNLNYTFGDYTDFEVELIEEVW